jgi:CPA2 family monovalent cation:H+ antiporter-2
MHGQSIIQDVVVLYGLALVFLLVGSRLRLPGIISLIVTGVIAGPGGLGLVSSDESVRTLSEVGIALLLFMVGLDLSVHEMRRLWRNALVGGGAQMAGTMLMVAPWAWWILGPRMETLLFVTLFVAISSTSIVVRELTRRNELHAPHGSLALGVLLLQDVLALLALVLAPVLFGSNGASLGRAVTQIAVIGVGLAIVTRLALPVLFRWATVAGREAFTLTVLVASLGAAWVASVLGLSMTVGAFLAGLVLDESEYSYQIHAEVRPLRDLLTSLFFVSVGLLVRPAELVPVLHLVLLVALGMVLLKAGGAALAFRLAGVSPRVGLTAALVLAQVGEFSFVLGAEAVTHGAIGGQPWAILLGASVLTMALSPAMVSAAPRLAARLTRGTPGAVEGASEDEPRWRDHVIILGFGEGGRLVSHALSAIGRPHVAIDLNGVSVRSALAAGHSILYGDATAEEPLRAAGIEQAAAVVAVLSDPGATERATRAARRLRRDLPIFVRTRFRTEAERMRRSGATLAVAEELEASIEVMAQMLVQLEVPGPRVDALVEAARAATDAPSARTPPPRAPAGVGGT